MQNLNQGEIIIYKNRFGPQLEVKLQKETVWLTQKQIALLFGTQRPAITKHLSNIFNSGELKKNSVSSILEHTAPDGKRYKTKHYSLDAIISVGYRVNSQRATQFRIWATKTLKKYLINGYAINEKRLLQQTNEFQNLKQTIYFLRKKAKHKLLAGQERELLNLLADYTKSLIILDQYDRNKVPLIRKQKARFVLNYENACRIISNLKTELIKKKRAADLFGQEYQGRFSAIFACLYQTFDGKELYSSLEEKAAHLLYLIIKDHPFADGNKRIAAFLFIFFLDKNNYLYKECGEKKINDNALVSLALLTAVSNPREKETIIRIITNLIK